jgi:PAS domain S-box-containing protein
MWRDVMPGETSGRAGGRTRTGQESTGRDSLAARVFEALSEPLHVVDREERILLCNAALRTWIEELGLSPDVVGKTVREAFPFLPPEVSEQYQAVIASGRSLLTEEASRPQGRQVHTQTEKRPILGEGTVTHVITILRDISAQRRAEEAARAEAELRRAVERSTVAAVVAVDTAGRTTYVNRAFCDLVGWPEERLLGETAPFLYWPPEKVDQLTVAFEAVLAGKHVGRGLELKLMRRSGERFDVLASAAPIHDSLGAVSGWIASCVDITDRKRAERALWLKELAIESTNEAIALADLGGKLIYCNRALSETWRRDDQKPWPGRDVSDLFESDEASAAALATLKETGACSAELLARPSAGPPRPVRLTASTVRDDRGHPLGSVLSIRV